MKTKKKSLSLVKRDDGVAVVTFDTPGSSVNVLSKVLLAEVSECLDKIATDDSIKAAVLFSGKPGTFIAGANLDDVLEMKTEAEGTTFSKDGHALLERIEKSKKPFVAAIHGAALGGGLEVALACQYRLASDDPKTVLALPEVMLGLLPGGGGTQRLPRLIGLTRALPMLLTGKRLKVKDALRDGLVDAVAPPGGFLETACRAAKLLCDGQLKPSRDLPLQEKVAAFGPARGYVLSSARDAVQKKTLGLYPAPLYILECVEAGLASSPDAGYAKEAELFGKLVADARSKNLVRLFDAMTALKKPRLEVEGREVRQLGVLGAGLMGQGIAAVSLPLNSVVIKDVSDEALGRAAQAIRKDMDKRVRRGSMTRLERDRQWFALTLSKDVAAIRNAGLVIEAVFEDLTLKRKVLAEAEAVIAPGAVYATNTSALPIRAIAEGAKNPERVLGMHYFSPVPKMPLLEIIRGDQTSDEAVATAFSYGVAQGKTVIVVKDGPGFYTTRILAPLLNEAILLLEEGGDIQVLDRALREFGFPVGPYTLMDEVGIDVAAHVSKDLGAAFAGRGVTAPASLGEIFSAGFLGRKAWKGFYLYKKDHGKGPKPVNDEIYRFFGGRERKGVDSALAVERLALAMVNEAIHCLGEGVLETARDGDAGAILGLGFPPFLGGPFRYADSLGTKVLAARLSELAEKVGPRFAPAPRLVDLANRNRTFHH